MSSLRDSRGQNIGNYVNAFPISQLFTTYGIEYEMEWEELAVPAGQKAYLKWALPADKYCALSTRLVQMDQERGSYKAFTTFVDGTLGDTVPLIKLRLNSPLDSGSVFTKMTGPTGIDQNSKIVSIPLIGSPSQGNTPVQGDLSSDSSYRLYPPGTEILIEFDYQSASASYFQLVGS